MHLVGTGAPTAHQTKEKRIAKLVFRAPFARLKIQAKIAISSSMVVVAAVVIGALMVAVMVVVLISGIVVTPMVASAAVPVTVVRSKRVSQDPCGSHTGDRSRRIHDLPSVSVSVIGGVTADG